MQVEIYCKLATLAHKAKKIVTPLSVFAAAALGTGSGGGTQTHARPVIVQKLDAAALKRLLHLIKGPGLGIDGARKRFHAPDGADGHAGRAGELCLIPSQENPGRPQLSAVCELQETDVSMGESSSPKKGFLYTTT